MSTTITPGPAPAAGTRPPRRPAVPWRLVALLAALMAYADGFWLRALQGAIGAIERTQGPFLSWLRDSTLLLPLYVLAVLAALSVGHRIFGPSPNRVRAVLVTGLLITVGGTALGLVAVAASSAYDYHLQADQLVRTQSLHDHAIAGHEQHSADPGACTGACQARRATLAVHVHAVEAAGPTLLLTNGLLVGWAIALAGGRLEPGLRRSGASRSPAPA